MTRLFDTHSNRGMEFEAELNAMHDIYRERKLADIHKNYVKTTVTGAGTARIDGKAIADYSGTIGPNGRSVAFDAKDCGGKVIALKELAEHQLEHLGNVYALGGLAFVLVRFEHKHVYRVPISAWADAEIYHAYNKRIQRLDGWKPKNKASLCVDDMLPKWRVDGVDWLRAYDWGDYVDT